MTGQLGVIYMLHFDQPYRHARHYVGWTDDLLDRLDTHARGHGARLVAVIWHAGIGFTLVRICEGTRRPNAPSRTRAARSGTARPAPPGRATATGRRCPPTSPPAPTSTSPEGGNPMPSNRNGSGRNQRNNPYQLDELFVQFHRTPAGIAWRWRTELAILTALAAALWRLDTWITLTWAAHRPGRAPRRGPGRAALPPVHHPAVLVRPGPAPPPAAVLRSPAAHPLRAAPAHPVDPADQGRRTRPGCCAARASAPRTSKPTSASCAPPATPATRGSPATAAGPTW